MNLFETKVPEFRAFIKINEGIEDAQSQGVQAQKSESQAQKNEEKKDEESSGKTQKSLIDEAKSGAPELFKIFDPIAFEGSEDGEGNSISLSELTQILDGKTGAIISGKSMNRKGTVSDEDIKSALEIEAKLKAKGFTEVYRVWGYSKEGGFEPSILVVDKSDFRFKDYATYIVIANEYDQHEITYINDKEYSFFISKEMNSEEKVGERDGDSAKSYSTSESNEVTYDYFTMTTAEEVGKRGLVTFNF